MVIFAADRRILNRKVLCEPLCNPWCPFVVKKNSFNHKVSQSKEQSNTKEKSKKRQKAKD
jgi:hypothetical protein